MGDGVSSRRFSTEDRQRYREKVRLCLDVFERMLRTGGFDTDQQLTGMEIELNLINDDFEPAFVNTELLEEIDDPQFCSELAQFNIEMNVPPRPLSGDSWRQLETKLIANLGEVDHIAGRFGAQLMCIGIIPTLMPEHFSSSWISKAPRYTALNDSIFSARGEDIMIDIDGPERLSMYTASIAPEAACTSVQLHLQVSPRQFADYWNAAQLLAAPQVALCANSPFLFGRHLWEETRIELFKQATDTRPQELRNQGVRPRVFFGERWITSVFDLFEENSQYFPALLPEISDEDPVQVLESGRAPALQELRLHNGTVYRWNRPVYDVVEGRPHLRVENRVLPAGPTIVDMIAGAMFYYGAVRMLAEDGRPLWSKMSFGAAHENFEDCARFGMSGQLYWPGMSEVSTEELVLRKLLPLAYEGLDAWGVDPECRDRYLGVIENRAKTGRTGAWWQTATVRAMEEAGADRAEALHSMLAVYRENMLNGSPVHTWEVPSSETIVVTEDIPVSATKAPS